MGRHAKRRRGKHPAIRPAGRRLRVERCESRLLLAGDTSGADGVLLDLFPTTDLTTTTDGGAVFQFDRAAPPVAADAALPPSDPLFIFQWPLFNGGGIDADSLTGPTTLGETGTEVNFLDAYQPDLTGNGAVTAIVGSGIQASHPDLAADISPTLRLDALNAVLLAANSLSGETAGDNAADARSTALTGVAGAGGDNGTVGVFFDRPTPRLPIVTSPADHGGDFWVVDGAVLSDFGVSVLAASPRTSFTSTEAFDLTFADDFSVVAPTATSQSFTAINSDAALAQVAGVVATILGADLTPAADAPRVSPADFAANDVTTDEAPPPAAMIPGPLFLSNDSDRDDTVANERVPRGRGDQRSPLSSGADNNRLAAEIDAAFDREGRLTRAPNVGDTDPVDGPLDAPVEAAATGDRLAGIDEQQEPDAYNALARFVPSSPMPRVAAAAGAGQEQLIALNGLLDNGGGDQEAAASTGGSGGDTWDRAWTFEVAATRPAAIPVTPVAASGAENTIAHDDAFDDAVDAVFSDWQAERDLPGESAWRVSLDHRHGLAATVFTLLVAQHTRTIFPPQRDPEQRRSPPHRDSRSDQNNRS